MGRHPVARTFIWLGKATSIVLFGLLAGVVYRYVLVHSNFNLHAVENGMVYRSGQMPADELARLVKTAGIRTVINLRGEHVGQDWYDEESQRARIMGVSLVNYPINSQSQLTDLQMNEISAAIRKAEKPVLIHCLAGSDRTGLACALYCVDAGLPVSFAQEQLSSYYGHFPHLLWQDSAAMDVSLGRYLEQASVRGANGSK